MLVAGCRLSNDYTEQITVINNRTGSVSQRELYVQPSFPVLNGDDIDDINMMVFGYYDAGYVTWRYRRQNYTAQEIMSIPGYGNNGFICVYANMRSLIIGTARFSKWAVAGVSILTGVGRLYVLTWIMTEIRLIITLVITCYNNKDFLNTGGTTWWKNIKRDSIITWIL